MSVTNRQVTVTSGTKLDFIYDGEQHAFTNLTVTAGSFVAGEGIATSNWATVTSFDEGQVANSFDYAPLVGTKLENYDITVVTGKIAVVKAVNEYSVRFNANGGSGTMVDQAFVYGLAKSLIPNMFIRTGYAFAGWATSAEGAVAYGDGEVVGNLTTTDGGVVDFYAKWTANPYTVLFDANGGEGVMDPVDCTYGVAQTLPANAFVRTGYAFAGWATSMKGAVAYEDEACVLTLAPSGKVTLYAQWNRNPLPSAAIAGIAVGSAAVVGVAGHFIGRAVSELIGKKKGNLTYKEFKAMKLVVPELDARGITYKNRLVYHPAKGTATGRIVLTVQKGDRTQTIRAKAKGTLKDGVITGSLDAKGLGVLDFTVK